LTNCFLHLIRKRGLSNTWGKVREEETSYETAWRKYETRSERGKTRLYKRHRDGRKNAKEGSRKAGFEVLGGVA
jgi:hypothetical protein